MKVIQSVLDLRRTLEPVWNSSSLALVPTMGALHQGHLSLVEIAHNHAENVLATIFVNPLQFNNPNDLANYPRTLEDDLKKLEVSGVRWVFAPSVEEIYHNAAVTVKQRKAGSFAEGLCGASRPGHFDGVVTVVGLLFELCRPEVAIFGEKDYQQLQVIRQLVESDAFPVSIIGGQTVREADGLALSSRNLLLSPKGRALATMFPEALQYCRECVQAGEKQALRLEQKVVDRLKASGIADLDYIEIRSGQTLERTVDVNESARIFGAVQIDGVRLIDNMPLG